MPPIATRPIWFETPLDLAVRWHREQDEAVREECGRPIEALAKAQERAEKVIAHGKLVPLRAMKTAREWQTRWDADAAMKMLREAAAALGHSVVIHSGHRRGGVGEELLRAPGGGSIILDEPALLAMADLAKREGLSLPLTARDMHAISLAGEVHDCLSGDMGGPALPWVHELAEPLFVQKVLGLPFSPMVWRFLPKAEATGRERV